MGFFSKYNQKEREILEMYTGLLSSMSIPDSQKVVRQWLDESIAKSKQDGLYGITHAGDHILKKEQENGPNENLEKKRKEGVRDEDIRQWFNLDDVERRMILRIDELHRLTLYIHEIKSGKAEEEALKTVSKFHPIYGDLSDERHGTGDDRPLPLELKDRINVFIEKQGAGNPGFKKEIDSSSTFNALVRREIRKGNI